jgi:hypothetical protein
MKFLQLIVLIICWHCEINSFSQTLYYQDICNCGVTGAGFSMGIGGGVANGDFVLNIDATSTIKKAYLIFNRFGNAEPLEINFNGDFYILDTNSQVGIDFLSYTGSPNETSAVHAIDVTDAISPFQNTYNITYMSQTQVIGVQGRYGAFYLVVIYENDLLTETAVSIILNDKNSTSTVNYNVAGVSPVDTFYDVGLAIHSDILWDTVFDGSYVKVNANSIGLIGGSDAINVAQTGAGVKGHFYYQFNQLFGLDDDTADNVMGGSDGLADIKGYLSNGSTSFDIELEKQSSAPYNIYIAFFLTYTTTCDTFSVSLLAEDTTICKGDSLQFFASGADSYEWSPTIGLSCDDCPNPKISPQQSTTYFLTSTKYGNCKKTQPIKIRVNENPLLNSFNLTTDTCGENSGAISNINASGVAPLTFSLNGNSSSSFSNLQSGWYDVSVTDVNGCKDDSLVFIESVIAAEANFSTSPEIGYVPLEVDFFDLSRLADNWIWYINGDTISSQNPTYIFDSIGIYTISQIAYNTNFGVLIPLMEQ